MAAPIPERLIFRQSPRDPAFVQDPYPAYARMRAQGPLVFWEDYGFWCLTGFDTVDAALRDRRLGRDVLHLTTRQALGWPDIPAHLAPFYAVEAHSLLESEPPVHSRLRALVNRAFVSRAIERLRPRVAELAHRLIDGFIHQGETDLIETFATPIPVTVIAELIGIPTSMTDQLLAWSHRMVAMYEFGRSRETEDAAVAATQAFVAFLTDYIKERRRRPGDDLVSHLIAASLSGDKLSEPELITTLILLLNAGHEATVHALGNGVKALLEEEVPPSQAFADEAATAATVEELLRFDPPLHLFTRYVLEPLTLHTIDFAFAEKIGLLLGAANRDPARFTAAEQLRINRTDGAHVSFGAGIHFCLGAPLARLELQIALPILFARLPGLRVAKPPSYADRYHFRGLERLDLTWG